MVDHRASLIVMPTAGEAIDAGAAYIADSLARAGGRSDRGGRVDWATTGGSTAPELYARLTAPPLRDAMPWSTLHVWWGDDRFVPWDHELSNVRPFHVDVLSQDLPLEADRLHAFRTTKAIGEGHGPDWAAERIIRELRDADLEIRDGWPVLDLILLGMGGDGHLLSVFPGSEAFDSPAWALGIPAPTHIEPHVPRVTLNPALIGVARDVLMVVTGAAKAEVLGEIFGPVHDPRRWPAQVSLRPGATWILDEAAARLVPR